MELYEVSKLKKFMNVVKFMMEDSLRFLIEGSLETYVKFIEVSASSKVHIGSYSDVRVVRTLDKKKFPLFMIDLGVIDNRIQFTTPLRLYEEKLINLYKLSISQLQNVPTLEREIMENLIWTHTPMLASVHHMEDKVIGIQTRITLAVEDALRPLNKYLETYGIHKDLMELNVEEYTKKYRESKHSLEQFKEEILSHLKKQEDIDMR